MDEEGPDQDDTESHFETEDTDLHKKEEQQSRKVIASAMIDSWSEAVKENVKLALCVLYSKHIGLLVIMVMTLDLMHPLSLVSCLARSSIKS